MPTLLVTGANQGLGLEFTRQYAADGWDVIACCRTPDRADELNALAARQPAITVEQLDISDPAAISALARRHAGRSIDLLLNNAGIIGAFPLNENFHRQHFGSVDYTLWEEVIKTNTFGPVRMAEAFVEHVANSDRRLIVSVSSTTGSITESNRQALAYTTSKTALNKAMTVIAAQLKERGIIVALVCPGYVKTRMNAGGATVEIPESVSGVRRVIDALTLEDTGCFRRYNGETIGW
jgi:NAD(P)-dependent dehydrogenase (short-subunit alcohol dehydrogenase family)